MPAHTGYRAPEHLILVTLVIRDCLTQGGPEGVLTFLQPDWNLLKEPSAWLEAASQVIFSLQLGLGAITSYSQFNKFRHNIIYDFFIIILTHLVWVLLATLFTFSLLGVAIKADKIRIKDVILTITGGHGVWWLLKLCLINL